LLRRSVPHRPRAGLRQPARQRNGRRRRCSTPALSRPSRVPGAGYADAASHL